MDPAVLQPAPRPATRAPDRAQPARAEAPHLASDRPRTLIAGTSDAWARFLEQLAVSSTSLAEALRLRGKLADLANGRALVQLSNLRDAERALVLDPRNQKAASSTLSKVVGSSVIVVFEDQSAVRAQKDEYTTKIAELFDGRIEDEG